MNGANQNAESLGRLKKTLKPKNENVVAGYLIVLLALCGGYIFIYSHTAVIRSRHILYFAAWTLLSSPFFYLVWRFSKQSVDIHEKGFVVRRGRQPKVFPYEQIECVREDRVQQGMPLKGPAGAAISSVSGKIESRSYLVVRKDGEEFHFDNNVVPRASLLAGPLRTAQSKYAFDWFGGDAV